MQVVDWISKQAGKLADNFNKYKFYVKHTPEHIDSSTLLSLTPFTSRQEQALVPCLYRWYRIKNGLVSEAEQFRGNSFICEPSDVGCIIQVEVTSTDQVYSGTAYLKYGPVQMDILLKQTVQRALSTGQAKFNVDIFHSDVTKQCMLNITDDFIKLSHCNSNANYKFYYSLAQPLFNTLPKDPIKIKIIFSQKFQVETLRFLMQLYKDVSLSKQQNSNKQLLLNIVFLNKKNKDEFIFIMKGFNAKKELKNSTFINKIEKMQIDNSNINYLIEIQSLRTDLQRLHSINIRQRDQKRVYYQQSCKLQQQIEDIISSYTKLIEGKFKTKQQFQPSFIEFQNRKDQAIFHRYQKIEEENNRLKDYIRQKLDGEHRNIDIDINMKRTLQNNKEETTQNPFLKKKQPYARLQSQPLQNILHNLSANDQIMLDEKHYQELAEQNEKLEVKLNKSLMKIQKLEGQIEQYQRLNQSAFVEGNQLNRSRFSNRNNVSALEISASKVIQEKAQLQRKYHKLKQENHKLKTQLIRKESPNSEYDQQKLKINKKGESSPIQKPYEHPEFKEEAKTQINRLKGIINELQHAKQIWKSKAELISAQLKKQRQQHEKIRTKLEKKIYELNQEVNLSRKNNDVLNRSQHLSMEMDDYNQQQNQILKDQNIYLTNENQKLNKMCEKYKGQYKRLKQLHKTSSLQKE